MSKHTQSPGPGHEQVRRPPPRPQAPMKLEGREPELQRLSDGLARATVGVVLGFAGMGKTALAATFANGWVGPVLFVQPGDRVSLWGQLARGLQGLDPEVGEVVAQGGDRPSAEARGALGELLTPVLEEHGALLWIDDLHRLTDGEQQWLLHDLAASLREGRLLVTSRRRPPVDLHAPPRVEVLLGPLDEEAAAALWQELDLLHGPVPGFEQAYTISGGVPLALSAVHAGGNATSIELDPVLAVTNALQGDELTVVRTLAVASQPIRLRTLRRVLPEERVRAALDGLRHRLVVDIDAGRRVTLPARFAESVLRWMSAEELAQTHHRLAELYVDEPQPDSDAPLRTAFHLLGAGDEQAAGELLAGALPACVRAGLLADCCELLDRIAPANRSVAVERARGLGYVLSGQPETGYTILRRLVSADGLPDPELTADLALSALLTGRVAEAEPLLAPGGDDGPDPGLALHRQCLLALTWTIQGRIPEAHQVLDTLAASAGDLQAHGQVLWARAYGHWLGGDDPGAERVLRESLEAVGSYVREAMLPAVLGSLSPVYARLGRFDEAEDLLGAAVALVDGRSLVAPLERSILLDAQGYREDALREAKLAAVTYKRHQMVLHRCWTQILLGRLQIMKGQVAAGQELLDQVAREAAAAGAPTVETEAGAPRALTPGAHFALGGVATEQSDLSLRFREQALAALQAVVGAERRWDQPALDPPEDLASEVMEDPGYGVERMVLRLAAAYALRLSDQAAQAQAALDDLRRQAHSESIDDRVLSELIDEAGPFFYVDGSGLRRMQPPQEPAASEVLWLDRTQHRLTLGDETQDLSNRPVMRRLLYSMAQRLPRPVDKATLVAEAWQEDYNPAQHDNPLRVNIGRLRKAVAPFGLEVVSASDGYRLSATEGFLFIERVFEGI